jgi:hypothetical protein
MSVASMFFLEGFLNDVSSFRPVIIFPAHPANGIRSDFHPMIGTAEGKNLPRCDQTFEIASLYILN